MGWACVARMLSRMITPSGTTDRVECPHCGVLFVAMAVWFTHAQHDDGGVFTATYSCPNCSGLIVYWVEGTSTYTMFGNPMNVKEQKRSLLYPRNPARHVPPEVPEWYRTQYLKAWAVLSDAPEASAAMSRRCLQGVLVDVAGARGNSLAAQIDDVIKNGGVPSYAADSLEHVRVVGNFAAHPIKSTSSGEVIDILPGEAEANIAALDAVFDHYFVQPVRRAAQKALVNAKLREAGKPELP